MIFMALCFLMAIVIYLFYPVSRLVPLPLNSPPCSLPSSPLVSPFANAKLFLLPLGIRR